MPLSIHALIAAVVVCATSAAAGEASFPLRGQVIDADTGRSLEARVYVTSDDGQAYLVKSAAQDGSAIPYDVRRAPESFEKHTTISAHPFVVQLPPGKYSVLIERGKEYLPASRPLEIRDTAAQMTIKLHRWIDMSSRGWYSGEMHVHRSVAELPNVMRAEDLNVALPLTYWTLHAGEAPGTGKFAEPPSVLIRVDATHVIYPRNSEFEIFNVGDQRPTLGGFLVFGHKETFQQGVPPVRPVAERVRREGGLIDLDLHNWPWSMMIVPVMDVDLYQLANHHMWRTQFLYRSWGEQPADWMQVERDDRGWTERGWIDFTLKNYYTLLNCGFRLRPSAGTASGVHPVPLGFSRTYVHVGEKFSYQAWMEGLDAGRSFVTNGPMLFATLGDQMPGHTFQSNADMTGCRLRGSAHSPRLLTSIEVVRAGEVLQSITPENRKTDGGGYETRFDVPLDVKGSTWFAMRCFYATEEGHPRFAHTAPWHVDIAGRPLRPRQREVAYLKERVESALARARLLVGPEAVAEYEQALARYEEIAETAR